MTNWRDYAACRNHSVDVFFPERGDTAGFLAAKAICDTCPVTNQCLQSVLDDPERDGVFGGTSANERRALRRQYLLNRRCVQCGSRFLFSSFQTVVCSTECKRLRRNDVSRQSNKRRKISQ